MSSGGILVAAHAVAVAAAEGAVLGEAAAAVLAVRAASLADTVPGTHWSAAEPALRRWEPVVAAVVELNARIRMLTARAERAGAVVAVPAPLSVAGRARGEARGHAAVAARELAEALAELRRFVRRREASNAEASARIRAEAEALLAGLDADANEQERGAAVRAAASASQDSALYLDDVRTSIAQLNAVVSRRRLAVQWMTALEVAMAAADEAPAPFLNTAARLRAVLDGGQDLSPDLRAEGAEAVAWAAAVTRRRYVGELMCACLAESGYTTTQEVGLALGLARPDWRGEHSAEVWVDQQGTVHGRLVREGEAGQAGECERERRARLSTDLRALARRLGADVITDEGYFRP